MAAVIVDAGPLVALFDVSDRHHQWVDQVVDELQAPLLLCEAVLAEAAYLLARVPSSIDALFGLLEADLLTMAFDIDEHVWAVRELLRKYHDRPMSLADACIVRMAEAHAGSAVFTLDSDFLVYRKHGRTAIDLIYPPRN
jgi:predicted nucleic acid-binding protein